MVQVKNIETLSTEANNYFAFIGSKSENISITYLSPDGEDEYTDYEAFMHDSGTLIKFNNLPEFGFTPWNMKVLIDEQIVGNIQWSNYEDCYEFYENKPVEPHSFLSFMKSRDIREINNARVIRTDRRCDNQMWGPSVGYFPQDGIKPSSMDTDIIKNFNAKLFRPVISSVGIAHITAVNFTGIDMTWRNWPIVVLSGKTLSGCLRQVVEWRDLYLAGLSTEQVAIDANNFINALEITQSMIDELKAVEVPMPVERFMRGYGTPRHGFSEKGILPDSIKHHIKKQLVYRTLTMLESQHPLHPEISPEIKTTELKTQQAAIVDFVYKVMPEGTDIGDITTEMIYQEVFRQRYNIEPDGRGPIHPANIDITEKAILASRFFDATQ